MFRVRAMLNQFKRDQRGTSALGHALIAALVAFILIGAAETFGASLGTTFAAVANSVGAAAARQAATAPSGLTCRPATTGQPLIGQCQPDLSYRGIAG